MTNVPALTYKAKQTLVNIFIEHYAPDQANNSLNGPIVNALLKLPPIDGTKIFAIYASILSRMFNRSDGEIIKAIQDDILLECLFEQIEESEFYKDILKHCHYAFVYKHPDTDDIVEISFVSYGE